MPRINTNIHALNVYSSLENTNSLINNTSIEKLSSGYRINRAADDAADLGISETMLSQIGGLNQASRNAQDAVSLVQTADGALSTTDTMLQRMRELALQSANGTNSTATRTDTQNEFTQLQQEITRTATSTYFNGRNILNASGHSLTFQVGATATHSAQITVSGINATSTGLHVANLSVSTQSAAQTALNGVDSAIAKISTMRATWGASQNTLEYTITTLNTAKQNLQASESKINDVDTAQEMVTFTRTQILSQAATALLSQANQAPQDILRLIQ